MAQLTIYLDGDTLKRIERSARQEKESVSGWVKRRLTASLDTEWPADYFNLFGALKDSGLARPAQPSFEQDCPRAEL